MNPSQEQILISLYKSAIALTLDSAQLIQDGEMQQAESWLSRRRLTLRDINRLIARAPQWGESAHADQAALDYIHADKVLERAIQAANLARPL